MGLLPQSPFYWIHTRSWEVAVAVAVSSRGGTREAQCLSPSNSAEARTLDFLFLKWQSFLNINALQTFSQSSFLPTIYSVIQLFANLLNPKKSHIEPINTEAHLTLFVVLQLGQAIFCTLWAWSWLRPFHLSAPLTTNLSKPLSSHLLQSSYYHLKWSHTGIHSPVSSLSTPQRKDVTILFPALIPLPGTEQKAINKF